MLLKKILKHKMNKVVNLLTLIVLFVWSFFALGSINDLNFSVYSIRSIPFLNEISYALTAVVFLLGLIRIKRRWEAIKDIKAFSKFIYTTRLSKKSVNLSMSMLVWFSFIFMEKRGPFAKINVVNIRNKTVKNIE